MPGPPSVPLEQRTSHITTEEAESYVEIRTDHTVIVPDANPAWDDLVCDLYNGHKASAQSKLFEESDWRWLYVVCESLNRTMSETIIGYEETFDGVKLKNPVYGRKPLTAAELNAYTAAFERFLSFISTRRRYRVSVDHAGDRSTGSPTASEAGARVVEGASADGELATVTVLYSGIRE